MVRDHSLYRSGVNVGRKENVFESASEQGEKVGEDDTLFESASAQEGRVGGDNNLSKNAFQYAGNQYQNDHLDDAVSFIKRVEEGKDFPVVLPSNIASSREAVILLLKKMHLKFGENEKLYLLKKKLIVALKKNHPVHTKIDSIKRTAELFSLAKHLNIQTNVFLKLSTTKLKTTLRDTIYENDPHTPLSFLKKVQPTWFDIPHSAVPPNLVHDFPKPKAAVDLPSTSTESMTNARKKQANANQSKASTSNQQDAGIEEPIGANDNDQQSLLMELGFKGIPLENPTGTNRCYLNSAANAILGLPDIDTMLDPTHPVHKELIAIRDGLENSTDHLRRSINTFFMKMKTLRGILSKMFMKFYEIF